MGGRKGDDVPRATPRRSPSPMPRRGGLDTAGRLLSELCMVVETVRDEHSV